MHVQLVIQVMVCCTNTAVTSQVDVVNSFVVKFICRHLTTLINEHREVRTDRIAKMNDCINPVSYAIATIF